MRVYIFLSTVLVLFLYPSNTGAQGGIYHSAQASQQPVEFAPGVISTKDKFEINTVFNEAGDSVIFARCQKDFKKCTMMQSENIRGGWSQASVLPFSGEYLDADPYYNEDYSQLYYISKRPITEGGAASESLNFWRVAVADDGWGEPEYLAELSSDADDLYPSFTSSGDMFFPSFRNGKRLMYVARKNQDGFEDPLAIPADVYGKDAKVGDSAVSRNGKSIIFSISNRADSKGRGDLYISHWKDGEWSVAKSLGDIINTADHEFTPIMSPDGEYLFFTRIENGLGNLYQVHKSLLDW